MWPVLLVAWLHVRFAPLGFNPTDDGYIVAQARRILSGEVPHRDLISPRPLGSALLHVVDLVLPLPLLEATRLVFAGQMVALSILLAWLVLRRPPWTWGPLHVLGTAGSVLVNLHVFPLMPWHTTDGLTLLAAGLVLLEHGIEAERRGWRRLAFTLLGASVLMKQSFILAPVLGGLRLVWARRRCPPRAAARELAGAAAWSLLPVAAYVGVVGAAGGLAEMRTQLGEAARVQTWSVVDAFRPESARASLLRFLGQVAILLLASWALTRAQRRAARAGHVLETLAGVASLVPRAALSIVILRVALAPKLPYGERWGLELLWALAVLLVARLVLERRFDGVGAALLVTGFMVTLSWGYVVPNLVAGSIALLLLHRTWVTVDPPGQGLFRLARLTALAGGVALFLAVSVVFVDARSHSVYFEVGEAGLTSALRPVDPDFGRVRTNPVTARYLQELRSCLERYPARRVAVLPDNPGLVPLLGLDNPFPVDWMFAPEIVGSEGRLVAAARSLDRGGDYLVLFQTFNAFDLRSLGDYPVATPASPVFFHGIPLGEQIRSELSGTRVACGGFTGVHKGGAAPGEG